MCSSASIWLKSKKTLLERSVEISSRYKGKLVAIYNGEIVAVSSDIDEVIEELKRKGIDPRYTLIEYVPDEELVLVI